MPSDTFAVGAAEADITPSWPMHLVGMGRDFVTHDGHTYAYSRRDEPATDVHDPITVQVTCLRDAERTVFVVSADLVYTVALDELRQAVALACNVPVDAVLYAATHNHNGPGYSKRFAAWLCQRTADCAVQAMAAAEPVVVEHAHGHFDRLIHDRAEPWGPVDGGIDVLCFRAVHDDRTVAMWWNYNCHACSLSWDFNQFSADYPGALRRHVAQATGEAFPITFLSGSTGNIQPIGMMRFTSPPEMYLGVPKGDYEMVDRLGQCVAEAGVQALQHGPRKLSPGHLSLTHLTTSLPIELLLAEGELATLRGSLQQTLSQQPDRDPAPPTHAEVARLLLEWVEEILPQAGHQGPTHAVSNTILRAGDFAVLFSPLEVAWQIGDRIRTDSPCTPTMIASTSQGYQSYLTEAKFYELEPDRRPYEARGLMINAGYSYTPDTPGVFAGAVLKALHETT